MKKAFLKPTISPKIFLVSLLLIQLHAQPALSATTEISATDVNANSITGSNIINFTGAGSLVVNESKAFNSLTADKNTFGNVNFSTISKNLSITNSIGASGKALNNISFNADATLNLAGDAYLNNGITTATNNTGSINLTGSNIQKIESSIGSINFNLKEISINQDLGAEFKNDVHAKTLLITGSTPEISGTGNLNFTDANLSGAVTISNSGNVNIGKTTISGGGKSQNSGGITLSSNGTLIVNNNNTSITNLTTTDNTSKINIGNAKSLNISGNIIGVGAINATAIEIGEASNTDKGTLVLSGKTTQTIDASIGESTNRLATLNISNIVSSEGSYNSSGVVLNNDAYLKNAVFSNASNTSKILINSGKTINLSRNISETNGGSGLITGSGTLILEGTIAQSIDANLGTSDTDRLGELKINNTAKITFNDASYLTKITSLKSSSLANNSNLNITTLDVQKSLKVSGSGGFEVANLNIESAENLTLDDDKTIKITNKTTGTGVIKTATSGAGNILFSATLADINVATQIGESTALLNKILINTNDKKINFNNDVFASSINFINSTGQANIAIASAKTLNIAGDITNLSDSVISGATGTLKLSGASKEQNIYAKIGTDTTKLGTLEIDNQFGATLYQNSFIDTLNLSNGALKIAGKTLTISNGLDLTNQSFTSKIIDAFGKIKSSSLTIDGSTNIAFDYSNNNVNLDYAPDQSSISSTTSYSIIETAGITGYITSVKVSDNSYLFDNILEKSGNNIETKIKVSDNFNSANIGAQNYIFLKNIMSSSENLAPKFFRISNKENLNFALTSLKPISLETFVNNALSVNDITTNSIYSHVKNINLAKVIDPKNKNNKIEKSNNFELWGQLFGDKSMQKSNDSKQKFSTNNFGGIIGIDRLIKGENDDIIIGSAITINKAKINDDLKIHSNDANYYQLSLYNNNFSKIYEGFYSKNLANFSFNQYKNLRNIKIENYQQIAKSNFSGKSYSFESGFGYKAKIFDNFSITPDLSLQYFKFSQNSYKEKGLEDIILKVKSTNYNEFIAKFGVDFVGNFTYSEIQYKPNFSISWDRKLKNNRQLMRANFVNGGQEISNDLTILQRDKLNLGIGLNLLTQDNHKFNFKYNLQLANRYLSNGGFAEYSWEF